MTSRAVHPAWFAAGIIGYLSACVTHPVRNADRPPTRPDEVRVYLEPLSSRYVEIAAVEASSKYSLALTAEAKIAVVIKRLQSQAASLGANGILLLQDISGADSTISAGVAPDVSRDHASMDLFFIGPGSAKFGKAVAIYVDPHPP